LKKCEQIVDIPAKKINNIQKSFDGKRKKKNNSYNNKNLKVAIGARIIIEENADRDNGIVKGDSETLLILFMILVEEILLIILE